MSMKIVISKISGRWLINGKPYDQTSKEEKDFFDQFIIAMKLHEGCEEFDRRKLKAS